MDNGLRSRFTKIKPIDKGWSEDRKYCVTDATGMKYLLRITPIERYEVRKSLFDMLERVAALGNRKGTGYHPISLANILALSTQSTYHMEVN